MENVKLIGASLVLSTVVLAGMYVGCTSIERDINNTRKVMLRQETALNKLGKQNAEIIKLIRKDLNSF